VGGQGSINDFNLSDGCPQRCGKHSFDAIEHSVDYWDAV